MENRKYPIIVRITVLPIAMIVILPFWIVLGIISTERLGSVLKQTGENLLKP